MDSLSHSFGPWSDQGGDAGAFRELLARPAIWNQERLDGADQALVINAAHPGAYLSIFRMDSPHGFALFVPQKCGLYEMHTGFDGLSPFQVLRCIRFGLAAMFELEPVKIIATPCPDWNQNLLRLARAVKTSIMGRAKQSFEPYRVKHFAHRDGASFGATICPFSRGEWESAMPKERTDFVCQ